MPFVAICPACLFDTPIDVARLRADGGRLACSRCANVFSGLDSLRYLDKPGPAPDLTTVVAPAPAIPATAPVPVPAPAPAPAPEPAPAPAAEPPVALHPTAAAPEHAVLAASSASPSSSLGAVAGSKVSQPSDAIVRRPDSMATGFRFGSPFDDDPLPLPAAEAPARSPLVKPAAPPLRAWPEQQPAQPRATAIAGVLLLGVLTLGLVLQLGIWLRQPLFTAVPVLKPALHWIGESVGRPIMPIRQLQAISIESFEIRQPAPGRLSAAGLLRNRSDSTLVWPAIELSLTDQTGTLIVRKVIEPQEYMLSDDQRAGFAGRSEFPLELSFAAADLSPASFAVSLFYP